MEKKFTQLLEEQLSEGTVPGVLRFATGTPSADTYFHRFITILEIIYPYF